MFAQLLGSQLTEGVQVEVNINEGLSPYFRWNDYRIEFAGGDREPAKVVMKDFHRVYPELVKDVNFPEFSEDFMEVGVKLKGCTVVCIRFIISGLFGLISYQLTYLNVDVFIAQGVDHSTVINA